MSWEANIRRVVPYTPGEQPKFSDVIKLNTNENPYPPTQRVMDILNEYECGRMRLYPDTNSEVLVNALADFYKVKPSQVFVGIGSDDVISMAFLTFFNSDKPILFPDITYSFYDVWAEVYRIPYRTIPLNDDFRIDPADYRIPNGGIIFPNPNAPTGVLESLETIEEILKANPDSVVMVDEAYIDFGGTSCLSLLEKYENLLIIQTFSKSRSMAGMRIGYAFGSERVISAIYAVRNSYNSYTMNYPSIMCGAEALKDVAYFKECTAKVIATRERMKKELSELGFSFPDSKTNFLFATHESVPAAELFNMLREKRIFVRYFKTPRIDNYLRITIGTDEQMDRVVAVLKEYLGR